MKFRRESLPDEPPKRRQGDGVILHDNPGQWAEPIPWMEPRAPKLDLTATTMTISRRDAPDDTIAWFTAHGQRVILGGLPVVAGGLGVAFQSAPGAPVGLAVVGDTVTAHDDGTVTVTTPP